MSRAVVLVLWAVWGMAVESERPWTVHRPIPFFGLAFSSKRRVTHIPGDQQVSGEGLRVASSKTSPF